MNALIPVETVNAQELFVGSGEKLDDLLARIRAETATIVPDLSTEKGRKAIASTAYKVAQSKTAIDAAGKELVDELKKQPALIDAKRKKARDYLDALRDEIRKPLDDWEAEQERVKQAQIDEERRKLEEAAAQRQAELEAREAAVRQKEAEFAAIEEAKRKKEAEEQAERDRVEREELARKEGEERAKLAAAEAIDLAKREAEEANERERLASERAEQSAMALQEIAGINQQVIIAQIGRLGVRQGGTIECMRETLEETKGWVIDDRFGVFKGSAQAAKDKAIASIESMIAQHERAESDKETAVRLAEEKAKREADALETARQAEAARIQREAKEREAEEAKRAANKAHRAKINNAALDALKANGIDADTAKKVVTLIATDKIPNVSVNY